MDKDTANLKVIETEKGPLFYTEEFIAYLQMMRDAEIHSEFVSIMNQVINLIKGTIDTDWKNLKVEDKNVIPIDWLIDVFNGFIDQMKNGTGIMNDHVFYVIKKTLIKSRNYFSQRKSSMNE